MSPPSMMVPRAYSYSGGRKTRAAPSRTKTEVDTASRPRVKEEDVKTNKTSNEAPRSVDPGKPKRITSISRSSPSQPVVIPTRTASPKKARKDRPSPSSHTQDDKHDPTALSPSMAALLAVTSIHQPRARTIRSGGRDRLKPGNVRQSVSSTSPQSWSILQSPPDSSDIEFDKDAAFDIEIGSVGSRSTLDAERTMFRSLSSDSIPSLDIESEMFNSPESPPMPRTPSSRRAKSPRRDKAKAISTSQPLAADEHPLALDEVLEQDEIQGESPDSTSEHSDSSPHVLGSREPSPAPSGKSQFRSNLTASLKRLKNAARSMSLPTPSVSTVLAINSRVLPDRDLPARPCSPLPMNNSAFSEKTSYHLSREDSTKQPLASDLYFSSTPSEEYRAIASSIQMQSYLRRDSDDDPLLDKATAPPVFLSSTPAPPILLPGVDSPRPREPRENGDFLRIVVLEMNMRRAGKLGNVGGRARIWIGPRAEKKSAEITKEPISSKTTRAERGMGEAVASELAEAMMADGDEATVVRSLQTDDESKAFDAEVHRQVVSRNKQACSKGEVPSRWQAALPYIAIDD